MLDRTGQLEGQRMLGQPLWPSFGPDRSRRVVEVKLKMATIMMMMIRWGHYTGDSDAAMNGSDGRSLHWIEMNQFGRCFDFRFCFVWIISKRKKKSGLECARPQFESQEKGPAFLNFDAWRISRNSFFVAWERSKRKTYFESTEKSDAKNFFFFFEKL